MRSINLTLPYPPSANMIWRYWGTRPRLSKAARNYHLDVQAAVFEAGRPRIDGRLGLAMNVHSPDLRQRDLSNVPKIVEDAMQAQYIFENDEQIDELHIYRARPVAGGKIVLALRQLSTAGPVYRLSPPQDIWERI